MVKTALITGASSGIGRELAKIFAAKGVNLLLVSRKVIELIKLGSELSEKHKIFAKEICKDLSLAGIADEVYTEAKAYNLDIEYVINNAGFGDYGYFSECDWDKQERMINLNIVALSHLTRLFLPDMIKKGSGRIMNVASTAAFQPGPLMSVYYATKAYVLSFTEALSNEVEGTGVTITALCPGPTESNFQTEANMLGSNLFKGKIASAKEVAEYGYNAMMKGKTIAIHGMLNKELAFFSRRAPKKFVTRTVRKLNEKR